MLLAFLVVSCAPSAPPSKEATAVRPRTAAAAPAPEPAAEASPRRRTLTEDDFVDSDANRDPFRTEPVAIAPPPEGPALMASYACSELQLTGVVSGGLNPHAMFRDPRGLGYTVRLGDRICKSAERVVSIVSDAVIVQADGAALASRISIPHPQLALLDPLSLR